MIRAALMWGLVVLGGLPGLACPAVAQEAASDPMAPERVLAFADFLRQRGDCERAISEYQRYLFSPAPPRASYAYLQIGTCLTRLDRPRIAAPYLEEALRRTPDGEVRDTVAVAYLGALLNASDYPQMLRDAQALRQQGALSAAGVNRVQLLETLAYLDQGAWEAADQSLAPLRASESPYVSRLDTLLLRGETLRYKSPALAALFSTLIPGAGKVYAGRTADGLYSLLLIGGTGWLAYEGFRDDGAKSVPGWIFATASATLYAGNIYGSAVAVRLYNARQHDALHHDIGVEIRLVTRL